MVARGIWVWSIFIKGEINSFWTLDCENKASLDLSVIVHLCWHEYLSPDPLLLTGAGTSAYALIVEVWEDCSVCVCYSICRRVILCVYVSGRLLYMN